MPGVKNVRDPTVFFRWIFFTNETDFDRMECASRSGGWASTNSKMLLNNTSESYHNFHGTIGYCGRFFKGFSVMIFGRI
jgi:hypothetical protein